MNVERELVNILQSVLGLDPKVSKLGAGSPLLGSVPELDSMAVVSILTAIEERFGFAVNDDDVDGRTFSSVDRLVSFVEAKLAQ